MWIDGNGRVCVADAYCPHLGADLGPDTGGQVCEGRLVCPFHGYEFATTGQCVATPFAPPPKTAKLPVYETQDVAGLIFAWWGMGGTSAAMEAARRSAGSSRLEQLPNQHPPLSRPSSRDN